MLLILFFSGPLGFVVMKILFVLSVFVYVLIRIDTCCLCYVSIHAFFCVGSVVTR